MLTSATSLVLATAFLTGGGGLILCLPAASPPPLPFEVAAIFVEYNATDGDAEVVVAVDADMGLERFRIVNPLGHVVLDLRSRHTDDVGIRKINLETPEPSLQDVLDAYPAGWYRFEGRAENEQRLVSLVWLSHDLPAAPQITFPLDGATNVPTSSVATWTAGADADEFFLEIDQDELGVDVKSNVLGDTTSFGLPSGWTRPNTEYQLGLGARNAAGNLTVVEISFRTAP